MSVERRIPEPVVLDIAYHTVQSDAGTWDVTELMSAIDAPSVRVGGVVRGPREAWAAVFAAALGGSRPRSAVLAHPTTWGAVRCAVPRAAADAAVDDLRMVPRAVLIAETHLEVTARRAVVVEVHSARVDAHVVGNGPDGWDVLSTTVVDDVPGRPALGDDLGDDPPDAVIVDGADPVRVAEVVVDTERGCAVGRVVAADRTLLHRFAGVRRPPVPQPVIPQAPAPSSRSRGPLALQVAAAVAVVAGIAATAVAVIGVGDGGSTADTEYRSVSVGSVSIQVPATWARTDAEPTPGQVRTVVADRDLGHRLVIVTNRLPGTATQASVATSLHNRIRQIGADTVSDFAADTRYAGRPVIAYRELAGSGGAVRWHVLVERAIQVSIGCQDAAGTAVERACRRAVGSATVVVNP